MFCRNCGKELIDRPEICPSCGANPMTSVGDVYNLDYDLTRLSHEQQNTFVQHQLTNTFSIDAVIGMHFLTLGLFTLIYFGMKHSKIPMIKHNDFKARKAIGFMFIPFFNLYWQFRFWLRLVDRVNLQLRLRGFVPTVSKGLMLAMIIVGLLLLAVLGGIIGTRFGVAWTVAIILVANLAAILVYPICIVQIQRACNKIVLNELGSYES